MFEELRSCQDAHGSAGLFLRYLDIMSYLRDDGTQHERKAHNKNDIGRIGKYCAY